MSCLVQYAAAVSIDFITMMQLDYISLTRPQGTPGMHNLCSRDDTTVTPGCVGEPLSAGGFFPHPKANARCNTLHVLSAGTFHGEALSRELRGRHNLWTASLLRFYYRHIKYDNRLCSSMGGLGIARLHNKGNAHASCTYQVYPVYKYLNLK